MRIAIKQCFLAAAFAAAASAQAPAIFSVLNNYSFTLPGLPNYGIAQGSVFVIFGKNIGPSQTPTLPDLSKGPLITNLNGVTITVMVNGTTVQAIPYYVSAGQLAAILPSNTPVGTGTITVTYNGQSASLPITVVPAAFGVDTLNGSGTGTAVAQDANNNYALVSPTTAANPGDVLVVWGSGLGASAGDETKYPFPQKDLTAASGVKVFIGGQPAAVAYAGRSQFPGVDQINVVVPAGVSGCNVSLVVQTGTMVGNTTSIPVATSGRACSDQAITGLLPADLQALLSKPSVRTGFLFLSNTQTQTPAFTLGGVNQPATTITTNIASGSFDQFVPSQISTSAGGLLQQASFGSCSTYQFQGTPGSIPTSLSSPIVLDAGTLTLTLPDGSTRTLTKDSSGSYTLSGSNAAGSTSGLFIPAAGAQFTFTNSGGADVGPISGATIGMPPALNWTNEDAIITVNRSQDLMLTWDKSNPYNGFVTIAGGSFQLSADSSTGIITGFTCNAPYSAGAFTVPSYVLLSVIPSQTNGLIPFPTGSLALSLHATPVKFSAPSIDYSVLDAYSSTGKTVTYQ